MTTRSETRTTVMLLAWVTLLLLPCARLYAQERMPAIPAEQMTEAQKKAVAEFVAARGGTGVGGPWVPLLRAPELLNPYRMVSDATRGKTELPAKLRELVVLYMSRDWTIQFEWPGHSKAALTAGLKPETVAALAEGKRPQGLPEDEEIVYNFISELNRKQGLSDATYAKTVAKMGEKGVVEMTALAGYYAYLGMITSVARTPPGGGAAPMLAPLPTTSTAR